MKLIFLDIDGVINSCRSVIVKIGPTVDTSEKVRELATLDWEDFHDGTAPDQDCRDDSGLDYGVEFGLMTVDPVCVALVNKLLDAEPNIGLVLSSTHRKFLCHSKVPFRSPEHLRRLRLYLTALGINVPDFFSTTPVMDKKRGYEIDAWLNHAYEEGIFDDTCGEDRYVILDDAAVMLDIQPLVRVDATHGFSFENYGEACRRLGLKEPGLVLL